MGVAVEARQTFGDGSFFVGGSAVSLCSALDLDVAPTELPAILLSDCYRDFAPNGARRSFAEVLAASVDEQPAPGTFTDERELIPTVPSRPCFPLPHDDAGAASRGKKLWLAWVKG